MHESTRISISPEAEHPDRPWERRLTLDGRATATFVRGDAVSLELTCGALIVLATNWDTFEGVGHWLHAIDDIGVIRDEVELPEQTGGLERVEVESADTLSFGFHGTSARWTVQVHPAGMRSFALAAMRRRPLRLWFARRHLTAVCRPAMMRTDSGTPTP